MTPAIYTTPTGQRYRPVGRIPYSELTVGAAFAQDGSDRVAFRTLAGKPASTGNRFADRCLMGLYNATVIFLESIEE